MKRFLFCLILMVMILSNIDCANGHSTTPLDFASAKKIILEKNTAWVNAIKTGDSTTMIHQFMKDGKISPPYSDPFISRPLIAAYILKLIQSGSQEYHFETIELYGNTDNLIEEGNYLVEDRKGSILDKGKYMAIWRLIEDDWKIYSKIWNTSMPAGR